MIFDVKYPILGFNNLTKVKLEKIDNLFAVLEDAESGMDVFTLANPYNLLKEYSFEIPKSIQVLLEIKEDSQLLVYCPVVLNSQIKKSVVNFTGPIVFNVDNNTCAQIVLDTREFPPMTIGECLKLRNAE